MKKAKKILVMVAALALTAALAIGGTLAYLTSTTGEVKNTFTAGNVTIELNEGKVYEPNGEGTTAQNLGKFTDNGETRVMANKYQVIPGNTYDKDPKVTVKGGSEECYLYVKFEESVDAQTYLNYSSTLTTDNGWALVNNTTNVWWRKVTASTADQWWNLLDNNTISVDSTAVTKDTMAEATASSLKWTAYAIQTANTGTADEAWAKIGN